MRNPTEGRKRKQEGRTKIQLQAEIVYDYEEEEQPWRRTTNCIASTKMNCFCTY